jgi:hypothetical protein
MSDPQAASPDDPAVVRRTVQDGLARLEEAGVRSFDEPAVDLIRNLLERARSLDERARVRLESRAAERLGLLEQSFERERDRARAALETLSGEDSEAPSGLSAAWEDLEGGRLDRVLRLARRRRATGSVPAQGEQRAERDARKARIYRDELADLTVSISRAQTSDATVEQAGLLNGRVLAARLLEEAEALSPDYRRSLVADLVDLAALLHLPELRAPRKRG